MSSIAQSVSAVLLLGLSACAASTAATSESASMPPASSLTLGWSMEIRNATGESTPRNATPLRFTLRRDGVVQTEFVTDLESRLHLSVVSRDLEEFQDLHPSLDPATGVFSSPVTLENEAAYVLLADFAPRGEPRTTARGALGVGSGTGDSSELPVDDGPQQVGRYTVTPEVASPLVAGVDLVLILSVDRDASSGSSPVAIGRESAHAVILRAQSLDLVPSRVVDRGGHGGMLSLEPNQIAFATKIPRPGRYAVFTKLPLDGRTVSVRNVYDVIAPPDGAVTTGESGAQHTMPAGSSMAGELQTIAVEAFQWGFTPATIRVPRGSHVRLLLSSRDVPHSLTLSGYDLSQTIIPGKSSSLEFVADRPGSFAFGCDVACGSGHREMQSAGGVLFVE